MSFLGTIGIENGKAAGIKIDSLLERLGKKTFFYAGSKNRDYELSNFHLQFFCYCLYPALYSKGTYLLQSRNLTSKLDVDVNMLKSLDSIEFPKIRKALIDKVRKSVPELFIKELNKERNARIKIQKAVNLYLFNQFSHLVDWYFAVSHCTDMVLALTDMLFSKQYQFHMTCSVERNSSRYITPSILFLVIA
jgi:hypothetical protein